MLESFSRLAEEVTGIFHHGTVYELCAKLSILALAFVAPIQNMLLSMLFLIVVDFITGLWAAIKEHKPITSSKLSRSVSKTLVYFTTVVVVHVTHKYMLDGVEFLPIDSFAIGFIALTELKSIFENLNRISKQKLLSAIIYKLSNEGRKTGEDLDKDSKDGN